MLLSLAVLTTVALLLFLLFERLRLPGLLGMILAGVLLGRYAHQFADAHLSRELAHWLHEYVFIDPALLAVSGDLRMAALIVILFRAGLGIQRETLTKVGMSALWMSWVPSIFEGFTVLIAAHYGLGLSWAEAGMLGFILAAVSPAVVVPSMLDLKDRRLGQAKGIPTLVLAAASIDDVFAITLFGAFLDIARGETSAGLETGAQVTSAGGMTFELLGIPISIATGIGAGLLLGYFAVRFFKRFHMRDTRKVIVLMVVAIALLQIQQARLFPFASLLGIMAIGFVILEKYEVLAHRLAAKFNKLWVFAELLLFVLIGAEVNIGAIGHSGWIGLGVVAVGLLARSVGVHLSLWRSGLNASERWFCVIAFLPKATVQAAIGGIALAMARNGSLSLSDGVATGEVILAVAVLSIVVTAPLGAIGIRWAGPRMLQPAQEEPAAVQDAIRS